MLDQSFDDLFKELAAKANPSLCDGSDDELNRLANAVCCYGGFHRKTPKDRGLAAIRLQTLLPVKENSFANPPTLPQTRRTILDFILDGWYDCDEDEFRMAILQLPEPDEKWRGGFEASIRDTFKKCGTGQIADLLRKANAKSNKTVVIKALQTIAANMPDVDLALRFFKEGYKDVYTTPCV